MIARDDTKKGAIHMSDSFITIIAIFLAAILMFIFPLMSMADRTDDISELTVKNAVIEFVDKVKNTGKLTMDSYNEFITTLSSTGKILPKLVKTCIIMNIQVKSKKD